MTQRIDHIAIGARTLEQGTEALQHSLGVTVPAGGKHPLMSTHNCLAQLGDERFIEVIAIDPEAPDPGRTRWFTLDDPVTQARLDERARPLCWVANTTDLNAIVANSPIDLGEVIELSRGDLSWRLTVPRDGSLPEHGLLPAFIEWNADTHPSNGMADLGLTLQSIEIGHPDPGSFIAMLHTLRVAHLANVQQAAERTLSFRMTTSMGDTVTLE